MRRRLVIFGIFERFIDKVKKSGKMRTLLFSGRVSFASRLKRKKDSKSLSPADAFNIFRPNFLLEIQNPVSGEVLGKIFLNRHSGGRSIHIELKGGVIKTLGSATGRGRFSFDLNTREGDLIIVIHEET